MTINEKYDLWVNNPYFDEAFREELESIRTKADEIEDRFYKDLEFGTAGMRGVIGAGTNRINIYVIQKATQGFADYLNNKYKDNFEKSVVIAYDSRHMSEAFSIESALVMAANGIKAYVFDSVRTTPELSFAVRHLKCLGGIMVTASHNPPEYNGYKVYDETGCQLIPDLAEQLVEQVSKIQKFDQVRKMTREEAVKTGRLRIIGEEVDAPYINMVKKVPKQAELIKHSSLKVVYTPLHGTGGATIKRALKELSFSNLIEADEQMDPDGDFPTCREPNPESEQAFEVAKKYAYKYNADLVIATDPDCDRMGILVKDGEKYIPISGNEIGALFVAYTLSLNPNLTPDNYIVNTIVSSDLAKLIADFFRIKLIKTLTGFKYIGEQIERDPSHFVMGYEESYGYLFDSHVRDKDAVMGTVMAIEMAEYYRLKGKTLVEQLDTIYEDYGYFVEDTLAYKFEGSEGLSKMDAIMEQFRTKSESLIDYTIKIDYLNDDTGLPKANVLKFYLDDKSWFVLRPSGTEPKLKVYFSICDADYNKARSKFEAYKEEILEKVKR